MVAPTTQHARQVHTDFKVDVHVTPSDIRHGQPDDQCNCPVAIALTRALRSLFGEACQLEPNVSDESIRLYCPERGVSFLADVPEDVSRFIQGFDDAHGKVGNVSLYSFGFSLHFHPTIPYGLN